MSPSQRLASSCFMPSRMGIPSVGRDRFDSSGLFLSTFGFCSQATMPHRRSPQESIRICAKPPSTAQSPVGSAAEAELATVKARQSDDQATIAHLKLVIEKLVVQSSYVATTFRFLPQTPPAGGAK